MNTIIAALSLALGFKRPNPIEVKAYDKFADEILAELGKSPPLRVKTPTRDTPRPRFDRSFSFSMDRTQMSNAQRIPYGGYHTPDEEEE